MKFEVQQTHQNYECWKTGIEINLFLNDKHLSAVTHPKKILLFNCIKLHSFQLTFKITLLIFRNFSFYYQWHWDVNQKVMLTNEKPIPVLLLANKVCV